MLRASEHRTRNRCSQFHVHSHTFQHRQCWTGTSRRCVGGGGHGRHEQNDARVPVCTPCACHACVYFVLLALLAVRCRFVFKRMQAIQLSSRPPLRQLSCTMAQARRTSVATSSMNTEDTCTQTHTKCTEIIVYYRKRHHKHGWGEARHVTQKIKLWSATLALSSSRAVAYWINQVKKTCLL